ncbi:hypothetical protein Purlil1_2252 [Purpureocillium lilacinum]|uniref:Rhodopsin domain-containing protein n=1 Tax=Purpureocillium lilacinum TaxID=33203 RepID=A0ABR0CAA0_PURLI|nr:hypothetical protein Purlil1_2252 [Purpureocillium lilacinum]
MYRMAASQIPSQFRPDAVESSPAGSRIAASVAPERPTATPSPSEPAISPAADTMPHARCRAHVTASHQSAASRNGLANIETPEDYIHAGNGDSLGVAERFEKNILRAWPRAERMSWTDITNVSDAELEAEVKERIALEHLPPWFTIEHLRESYDAPAIAIIIAFAVLVVVVVICRVLSRRYVIKRFGVGLDDGLARASLAIYIPFVVLSIHLITLGSGRHFDQFAFFLSADMFARMQIMDSVTHLVYTTALWLCRISGLAFYYRMCNLHREFLISIKVIFAVLTLGYLVQIGLIVFHCQPISLLWAPVTDEDARVLKCMNWLRTNLAISGISLLCDLLLFGLPAAMLWVLKISRKKKVQLAGILLPGVAVVAISAARVAFVVSYGYELSETFRYSFLKLLCVETAEISATLIALSVPGIKPMFDKYILRKDIESVPSGRGTPLDHGDPIGSKDLEMRPWTESDEPHLSK